MWFVMNCLHHTEASSHSAVQCSELVVHLLPPHSVLLNTAKDGPKHPTLEHFENWHVLLEHSLDLVPVQIHRPYHQFVHGRFDSRVDLFRSQVFVKPIAGPNFSADMLLYFMAYVVSFR